jgi:hypothetical protein
LLRHCPEYTIRPLSQSCMRQLSPHVTRLRRPGFLRREVSAVPGHAARFLRLGSLCAAEGSWRDRRPAQFTDSAQNGVLGIILRH